MNITHILKEIRMTEAMIEIAYKFLGDSEKQINRENILISKGIITEADKILSNLEINIETWREEENE